ncbi:MAG: PilZ domain-containing protein [Nitrospira sp.]
MERRQHRRVSRQVKSLLRVNSHEVEGETIDLSLGGARIDSALAVQPGKPIVVKLLLPGHDMPVVIEQARVQWTVDRTFGVRFLDVPRQERDELGALIDDCIVLDEGREA